MQRTMMGGFSKRGVFISIVLFLLVLAAGWYILSGQLSKQGQEQAVATGGRLVKSINDQDYKTGYELFSDELKNNPVTYPNWSWWASQFKTGDIVIKPQPDTVSYAKDGSYYQLTYSTNKSAQIVLEVKDSSAGWVVQDYAAK